MVSVVEIRRSEYDEGQIIKWRGTVTRFKVN